MGGAAAGALLRGPGRLRRPVALVGRAPGPVLGRPGASGPACCPASRTTDVLPRREMPGAEWFPGDEVNFAEQVFRQSTPDHPAIIATAEDTEPAEISWARLRGQVGAFAATLRRLGVGPGDRVGGYLPNVPEAVVAFLGAASVGAVWSACAPDFGTRAVLDRFAQIEPTVLVAVDGYRFNGREFDRREVVAELRAALPERADDDLRAPAVPGRAARRRAGLGGRRRRRAGAGVRADRLRRPAVDRLLVRHHRPAQGHRARARRGGARAAQAGRAAHGRRRRRPLLLVRLDRLDHVEHRDVDAAVGLHAGGARRRAGLPGAGRAVRPRGAHRDDLPGHQRGLPERLREGGPAAGRATTTSPRCAASARPAPRCRRRPSAGSTTRCGTTCCSAPCRAAPTSPPASSAPRRCCR